jgi:hypothetical protein
MGTYTALPNLYLPSQAGAPLASGINNTVGELISLLDGILISGYGSVTLSSLVVSSGVATATVSTGHGFANVGTYGPVVAVDGATPTGLNGKQRITVTSSTTFTFTAPGIDDGTATGTITAKMAPAGWTKEFSGTNKAVYRPGSGLRHYLLVDDTVGAYARVRGFVSMTDIDTGTDPFPTDAQVSGGLYAHKSADTTRRLWFAVADERRLYWFDDVGGSGAYYGALVFGQLINALPGDGYTSSIMSVTGSSAATASFGTFGQASGSPAEWIPRSISQTGTCVAGSRMQAGRNDTNPGVGSEVNPPPCGFRRLHKVEVWEGTQTFRGWLPGAYAMPHSLSFGNVLEGFDGELAGRTIYTIPASSASAQSAQIDITGPWFDG